MNAKKTQIRQDNNSQLYHEPLQSIPLLLFRKRKIIYATSLLFLIASAAGWYIPSIDPAIKSNLVSKRSNLNISEEKHEKFLSLLRLNHAAIFSQFVHDAQSERFKWSYFIDKKINLLINESSSEVNSDSYDLDQQYAFETFLQMLKVSPDPTDFYIQFSHKSTAVSRDIVSTYISYVNELSLKETLSKIILDHKIQVYILQEQLDKIKHIAKIEKKINEESLAEDLAIAKNIKSQKPNIGGHKQLYLLGEKIVALELKKLKNQTLEEFYQSQESYSQLKIDLEEYKDRIQQLSDFDLSVIKAFEEVRTSDLSRLSLKPHILLYLIFGMTCGILFGSAIIIGLEKYRYSWDMIKV